MEIHLAIPNFGPGSTPEALIEIAEEAEALGFDGIASTDHLLVPRGQPERYERIFDALAVLAYLAGRTRRVKLITSVVVVLMRNPFAVAKQAATIDQLSGGRLVLGLGAGWQEQEFANVHAEFRNRGRRLDEVIRLFRHLFSGSREAFAGEYYAYDDGVFDPLPVRGARLPILLGGNSDAAVRRAARVADSWESTASTSRAGASAPPSSAARPAAARSRPAPGSGCRSGRTRWSAKSGAGRRPGPAT